MMIMSNGVKLTYRVHFGFNRELLIQGSCLTDELSFVDTKLTTEYGDICVKWKRTGSDYKINVTVPFNTTATFILDGKETAITCGEYTFNSNGGEIKC